LTDLQQYIHHYFQVRNDDLEKLGSLFHQETLVKGSFYVHEGQRCDKLSFIRSGLIRIYSQSEKKEVTQWISTAGHFLTDLRSLSFGTACRWNMQALVDAELYTIPQSEYRRIAELIPNWHELEKLFIAKCFITLEERVFDFIALSSEERYGRLLEQQPELFNQVPLQYLASMLGMTPETFSRIRARRKS